MSSSVDIDMLDAPWRKSRRSVSNGACVEAASGRQVVMVRDSVDPAGPVVRYSAKTWLTFVADIKVGSFEVVR
jgi:hypothetical protein